jgi:opacity protein-like surface antigen
MKKQIILLVTVFVTVISQVKSQQQSYGTSSKTSSSSSSDLAFSKDTKVLNIGIGVAGSYFGSGLTANPPVSPFISFEKGIADNMSIGLGASYGGAKGDFSIGYGTIKESAIAVTARYSYHFLTTQKLDPYIGVALGYVSVSASDNSGNSFAAAKASGIGYAGFIGVRYYFAPKFGIHAEAGFGGLALVNAGVSIKF